MKKRSSLIKLIQTWGIIFLTGIIVVMVAIDFIGSYRAMKSHADQMRTDYIARQKQMVKQEVKNVVEMIRYEKSQGEMLTKKKVKSRIYEAYAIAQNIYQQNKTTKSKTEIQQMILDALRPIRFEHGSGYYFATRLDGVAMLFADKPEMEGLNLLDIQDSRSRYVIKDLIEIAKQSGEGFYEYLWTKPDSAGNDFKKISFIKRFEPYDWFIGTGLYVDDVESQIKADLLSAISRIRFGKEGYIFINRLNGDALVSNGKLFSGTQKLWEVFNKDPEKMKDIFEKEYNAALKPDGDYIYYSHIKLTSPDKESPKASFIYGIPDLQWLVGAGVYLDDVDTDIALMQIELNHQIKAKMLFIVLIGIVIGVLFFLFFNWLNRGLKNDFNLFISFFDRVTHSDEEIDRETIRFIELDQMAEYANKMLTNRKQVEAALRESEEKFRNLFNNAEVGMFRTRIDGSEILDMNEKFLDIFGRTREEMQGSPSRIHWADPSEREEMIRRLERKGRVTNFDCKMLNKQGEVRSCLASLRLYREQGILEGSIIDITDRKQAEEEKFLLATAIEQASESIIIADRPGVIQYVNPAFERLSGFNREEIIGHNFRILKSDKHDEDFYREMYDVISHGQPWSGRIVNTMKNGSLREFETRISPVKDSSGEIINFVSVNRDVTQEKALEAQLRHSQRMDAIGTLAGGVAHDFNNILSAVIGFTELALDDAEKGTLQYEYLQEVMTAGNRAKDLVLQILTFSRQSDQEQKPVNVKLIAKEALKMLRASIPSTIEIKQNIQSEALVMGDATQIHQVLMNLCTNATHAMEDKGGVLTVDLVDIKLDLDSIIDYPALKPGTYISLTVTDTGHGMAADVLDKIFNPFFTTKEKSKGTGMGLSVVHGIVRSHGGGIYASSEPGQGASFRVLLPSVERRLKPEASTDKPIPKGTERILFVDDELAIVNMGKRTLESLGYDVVTRTSSIEALEFFKTQPHRIDIVITDLTMPNMAGEELARELMQIRPDIPIILCTGFSAKMDEKKAMDMGLRAFVSKPILKREIAETIRKVIDDSIGA